MAQLSLCVEARRLMSHLVNLFAWPAMTMGGNLVAFFCACVSTVQCVSSDTQAGVQLCFSSHCNSDSKTVCLIVLHSFHLLHKAGK